MRSRPSLTTTTGQTDHYGWTHIVLVSDNEDWTPCSYGSRPFDELFGYDEKYTFAWLRFSSHPTDQQLDDILLQIRQRTRGLSKRERHLIFLVCVVWILLLLLVFSRASSCKNLTLLSSCSYLLLSCSCFLGYVSMHSLGINRYFRMRCGFKG